MRGDERAYDVAICHLIGIHSGVNVKYNNKIELLVEYEAAMLCYGGLPEYSE